MFLRPTFASILIAEGHDPVFVSRQLELGHASPAITLIGEAAVGTTRLTAFHAWRSGSGQ